jgi:hypothetical protein
MLLGENLVETQLRSDAGYLRLKTAESQAPFGYVTSALPTPRGQPRWAEGRVAQGLGPAQVPAYEKLLGTWSRNERPAAGERPSTELFGTAPYKTTGRGGLLNDQGAALGFTLGATTQPEQRSRRIAEKAYDTFDFVSVPLAVQASLVDRFGESSRAGPVYARTARE